jgi:hypothetical protein
MLSFHPFLWVILVLVPSLLSVGLWATSPPDWRWPHQAALCFGYLTLCTLLLVHSSFLWLGPLQAPPKPCWPFTAYTIMQKACRSITTLCQHLNQKYWAGISKGDHASCCCHRRRGQQVCWTYLSQLGISDGGGVQDEALQKVLHTQVPQRLNNLFFPTRKLLKIPLHMLSLSETLLMQVINTTHQLLNHTNPTLAHGCWIWQWTDPSQVIASTINISTPFTLNCSFTKRPTASTLSPVPLSQPALSACRVPQG